MARLVDTSAPLWVDWPKIIWLYFHCYQWTQKQAVAEANNLDKLENTVPVWLSKKIFHTIVNLNLHQPFLMNNIQYYHTCARVIEGQTHIWIVSDLWSHVASLRLAVRELPIEEFNLNFDPWFQNHTRPTLDNIIGHYLKLDSLDMNYPIILDPDGRILDGVHRLMKAIIERHQIIKAVQLVNYPPASLIEDDYSHIKIF